MKLQINSIIINEDKSKSIYEIDDKGIENIKTISNQKNNVISNKNILNIKKNGENFIENCDNPDQKNLLFVGNTGLRKNVYD